MILALSAAVMAVIPSAHGDGQGRDSTTVRSDFDLARAGNRAVMRDDAAPAQLRIPDGMDTRDVAIDAPELELPLADHGPVVLVGAMGGRHSGMPKLAHVAVGWSF